MGWREDCLGWADGEAGNTFRLRRVERRACCQRQWPGSHVTCVCLSGHNGHHESEDGEQWEDVE